MDGLDACRLIKEDARTRDIPVIFLSARDETEMKVSGLTLGANDYISKPFKAEDRKSTRLNSSHSQISYAVFCLKKKNQYNHFLAPSPAGTPPLVLQLLQAAHGVDHESRVLDHVRTIALLALSFGSAYAACVARH